MPATPIKSNDVKANTWHRCILTQWQSREFYSARILEIGLPAGNIPVNQIYYSDQHINSSKRDLSNCIGETGVKSAVFLHHRCENNCISVSQATWQMSQSTNCGNQCYAVNAECENRHKTSVVIRLKFKNRRAWQEAYIIAAVL